MDILVQEEQIQKLIQENDMRLTGIKRHMAKLTIIKDMIISRWNV